MSRASETILDVLPLHWVNRKLLECDEARGGGSECKQGQVYHTTQERDEETATGGEKDDEVARFNSCTLARKDEDGLDSKGQTKTLECTHKAVK